MDNLPLIINRFLSYLPAIIGGILAVYLYRRYKTKEEREK